MSKHDHEPVQFGLGKNGHGYNLAVKGLTRGEVLELFVVIRRLDLYRTVEIDSDVVENAMRTMARFEVDSK